jgi:hypothetical protein
MSDMEFVEPHLQKGTRFLRKERRFMVDSEGILVWGGDMLIPFPFDHFFFCFLPPADAAGAFEDLVSDQENLSTRGYPTYHVD